MTNYVGIDLGTTNSAICTFDGEVTNIYKSPQQNDVTPSAIYMDKRSKYIGQRAYDLAPFSPNNSATLFKRIMGTGTPVQIPALDLTMSPIECSAEILKTLFGYLPEEVREDNGTGTVITVPAAFNQMQKDATMQAAYMAGIGKVALMQEPVAAVMSVMKQSSTDGVFLIYDLGGGTLDVAIAESINGRVSLLAHGGIAMCGGRDFDRRILDKIVRPWLCENFKLPENVASDPEYKTLFSVANWAVERAKIELSSKNEAFITLSESELRQKDLEGNDIYLEIPFNRTELDPLIQDIVQDSIDAARETISKTGLSSNDFEKIVFIGGPTHYQPLIDRVSFELGITKKLNHNPMTAVAEGASIFAESIDWSLEKRTRKSARDQVSSGDSLGITFNYISRTPDTRTKIAVVLHSNSRNNGATFQIDSLDTGWTSGRIDLKNGFTMTLDLPKIGENLFKIFVFDSLGTPIKINEDRVIITRTAASIDAIPASHSVGIEVLEKVNGSVVLDHIVRQGDQLPVKGQRKYKAATALKAGDPESINFKVWEGEIENPITDNRPIGTLKISGTDFDAGVIYAGADIICDFEIMDSGNLSIEVSVPSIAGMFKNDKNFYARQDSEMDFSSSSEFIVSEAENTMKRVEEIEKAVDDPRLESARNKLESAVKNNQDNEDTETAQRGFEEILEAKKILSKVRDEHKSEMRNIDLDRVVKCFDDLCRENARESESSSFDNLVRTAKRSIEKNNNDAESLIAELWGKVYGVLWRQDWFVIERFKKLVSEPYLFTDKRRYGELVNLGNQYVRNGDIDNLRQVVFHLHDIQIHVGSDVNHADVVNIIRG